MENFARVQEAKDYLKSQGYYTDNLWSVVDVKTKFECTDDEAYEVLDGALTNEATYDQIWFAIDFHGEDDGLKKIEE